MLPSLSPFSVLESVLTHQHSVFFSHQPFSMLVVDQVRREPPWDLDPSLKSSDTQAVLLDSSLVVLATPSLLNSHQGLLFAAAVSSRAAAGQQALRHT
jgi:hypothetical protein